MLFLLTATLPACFLTGNLGFSDLDEAQGAFGEFVNRGIGGQNMIPAAAGLTHEGTALLKEYHMLLMLSFKTGRVIVSAFQVYRSSLSAMAWYRTLRSETSCAAIQ